MNGEQVLQIILKGQETMGRKVDRLNDTVVELKTKVENWEQQRADAQETHDKCRAEQDKRWNSHAGDHQKLNDRIKPIENKRLEDEGGSKGRTKLWKIISAALGTGYLILSAIAIFNPW